ncbi:MAG TPA: tRNA (adenosine(37)-N6)-threonylcarbamoyltransferase complex transferase subunit TsaD [Candidatus Polarisedimenticolaceae bacterium]|nr:tRNA (adenosine(37)-N6)-threonylcarbamoyltransferase complex transferase subunit TsaD [Candidatus Polarisedimenticolaceae bacterium]
MARILAIESSCDETAAAVVEDRCHVLSSVVASQDEIHAKYGGVVPELASRRHVECIGPVIVEALAQAGGGLDALSAIAVTRGPGLVGSLLVGLCAAKAIAWQRGLPLLGINHLEGHVRSPFLENPGIEFPAIALVVSGGHTALYLCPEEAVYRPISRTRDDAAGEAFDKVAKLLGLGYPGGPVIDRLSDGADEQAFEFPRATMKNQSLDFSFSGLKTAVRIRATELGLAHARPSGGEATDAVRDLVASFQRTVAETLVATTLAACRRESVPTVLLSGGVACNRRLRRAFAEAEVAEGLRVYAPSPRYTTDNAAMIGEAAFLHLERGDVAPWDVNADAQWKLGT